MGTTPCGYLEARALSIGIEFEPISGNRQVDELLFYCCTPTRSPLAGIIPRPSLAVRVKDCVAIEKVTLFPTVGSLVERSEHPVPPHLTQQVTLHQNDAKVVHSKVVHSKVVFAQLSIRVAAHLLELLLDALAANFDAVDALIE